jgi:glycosyltransferase involved in cell wall biosynthesis
MYHGNLAASFTRILGYNGPVAWNIRHSVHDLSQEKWGTRNVIRLGARASATASRIIYNSETAAAQHERLGYRCQGRVVVPNGFDVQRFAPNPSARRRLRDSMGILDNELLLGVVGRSHPMKNHVGWVRAFARLVRNNESLHCLMMGAGLDEARGPVAQAVREAELSHRVHFRPTTDSPEVIYPAMDLLVLPSAFGEGVSNVVGEAMACGVPAAVTDVGDSPVLVGETGFLIKGTQPEELAAGVEPVIQRGQGVLADLGGRARQRVIDHYSLEAIGKRYYAVLCEALDEQKS